MQKAFGRRYPIPTCASHLSVWSQNNSLIFLCSGSEAKTFLDAFHLWLRQSLFDHREGRGQEQKGCFHPTAPASRGLSAVNCVSCTAQLLWTAVPVVPVQAGPPSLRSRLPISGMTTFPICPPVQDWNNFLLLSPLPLPMWSTLCIQLFPFENAQRGFCFVNQTLTATLA